jgi:hypothetical protein
MQSMAMRAVMAKEKAVKAAAETETPGKFFAYSTCDDGTLEITGFKKKSTLAVLNIPALIGVAMALAMAFALQRSGEGGQGQQTGHDQGRKGDGVFHGRVPVGGVDGGLERDQGLRV